MKSGLERSVHGVLKGKRHHSLDPKTGEGGRPKEKTATETRPHRASTVPSTLLNSAGLHGVALEYSQVCGFSGREIRKVVPSSGVE